MKRERPPALQGEYDGFQADSFALGVVVYAGALDYAGPRIRLSNRFVMKTVWPALPNAGFRINCSRIDV